MSGIGQDAQGPPQATSADAQVPSVPPNVLFAPNKVAPDPEIKTDGPRGPAGKSDEAAAAWTPPAGVNMADVISGGPEPTRTKIAKYLQQFDKNQDGHIDVDELTNLVQGYALERQSKKMLIRVIIALVIFGILLVGALTGMTWGVVFALKDSKIKNGVMYDADAPDQVIQVANNELTVVGGVLVNRQALATSASVAISAAAAANGTTTGSAASSSSGGVDGSAVLRTATFVGTPQKFTSEVSVRALMELKYLYIQGAGQVEVALIVLGVARVPVANSVHGTVVKIITMAGTITLDGTAIDFDEVLAPIFVEAGFIVSTSRRSLLGIYDILGFFNYIEDVNVFNLPSGEPRPRLPSGNFRMRLQIYEQCSIPMKPKVDRCAYLLPAAPATPPPPGERSPPPPPMQFPDYDSPTAPPPASPPGASSGRRRLQQTTPTGTPYSSIQQPNYPNPPPADFASPPGGDWFSATPQYNLSAGAWADLAGTVVINRTRYMVHTESSTLWNGLVRTVYQFSQFPDFMRVEVANNDTGVLHSWVQQVSSSGGQLLLGSTYHCGIKPYSLAAHSFGNPNETLVNFTFVGYDEHQNRSARHFRLVVKQPERQSFLANASLPPPPKTITVDYWDSRSGGIPLGFEFNHPWLGRTMIQVTDFVQLNGEEVDPGDFIFPLEDPANSVCTNDTTIPRLISAFDSPDPYDSAGVAAATGVVNQRRLMRQLESWRDQDDNAVAQDDDGLVIIHSSSSSTASTSSGAGGTALASSWSTRSGSSSGLRRRRLLTSKNEEMFAFASFTALDKDLWCGGTDVNLYKIEVKPCEFAIAFAGATGDYPYIEFGCGGGLPGLPLDLTGHVNVDLCPSNTFVEGCLELSLGLKGLIEMVAKVEEDGMLGEFLDMITMLSLEVCAGYNFNEKFGYVTGHLSLSVIVVKAELIVTINIIPTRVWIESVNFKVSLGINLFVWSYWSEVGDWKFAENYIIWGEPLPEEDPAPGSPSPVAAPQKYIPMLRTKGMNTFYLGCYKDAQFEGRIIPNGRLDIGKTVTVANCRAAAIKNGYRFFGLENGNECWMTNDIWTTTRNGQTYDTQCNLKCTDGSKCGGNLAMSLYDSGYLGCFKDSFDRLVHSFRFSDPPQVYAAYRGNMTIDKCRAEALKYGFEYYSLQAGSECWATNAIAHATQNGPSSRCTQSCQGYANDWLAQNPLSVYPEPCGGPFANLLFSTVPDVARIPFRGTDSPTAWVGCYNDLPEDPLMVLVMESNTSMNAQLCRWKANEYGFRYFAVQTAPCAWAPTT
ncbi:hypothetical protein Agub_g7515 [Astrephomene gubernaculifera]|uniref:EF-hand domain-containing protein n=1 Tax=Astrephomene gubernaculifera TaxID=47775 RepID=A0AAD3DQ74_9CHLO|nr:hypothetical protein Agub_g7515 [Astrephomene gubernaculifera]